VHTLKSDSCGTFLQRPIPLDSHWSQCSSCTLSRKLAYYRSPPPDSLSEVSDEPVVAYSTKVVLDDQKRYINTLSITSPSPCNSSPAPAVLLHGYGAGLGFFFKNFATLGEWAASRRSTVYALDWLGMGRSARVPFVVNAKRDDIPGRVSEAEAFFVDSLEEWREKMKLEKMTLVGHSLGAYMSVAYALKYPARVSRLVLLSPAGVPGDPNTTVPSREITDDQTSDGYVSVDDAQLATKAKVEEIKSEQRNQGRRQGRFWKLFTYLWEEGWSPFQVVRSAMWYGPILVGKYSARRFPGFTEEETREMHDYILNITLAKGSGEYCICSLLLPFLK
jgi:cardiolipin-specific phospholipase